MKRECALQSLSSADADGYLSCVLFLVPTPDKTFQVSALATEGEGSTPLWSRRTDPLSVLFLRGTAGKAQMGRA